eukprot:14850272-Alexandrium_andersonii.AAC.1
MSALCWELAGRGKLGHARTLGRGFAGLGPRARRGSVEVDRRSAKRPRRGFRSQLVGRSTPWTSRGKSL